MHVLSRPSYLRGESASLEPAGGDPYAPQPAGTLSQTEYYPGQSCLWLRSDRITDTATNE